MATINFNTFNIFITSPSTNMRHKRAHWGQKVIYTNNQGAREMCMSLHDLQKITKLLTRSLVKDMITCLNMLP